MITYIEKGYGLHEAVEAQGYFLDHKNGVARAFQDGQQSATIDTAVQDIIDGYDEIDHWKAEKAKEIKVEGLRRINLVYPAVQTLDDVKLIADLIKYMRDNGAAAPTGDLETAAGIYTAARSAAIAINGMTVIADVKTYDTVGDPAWP